MPPFSNFKKRRPAHGPTKNELKVSRGEMAEQQKSRAGTLRERFSQVTRLKLELRMETPAGVVLETISRIVGPDETLLLDLPCTGGCRNGVFLLKEAVEALIEAHQERREGLGICQGISYVDPKLPCGTKLYYSIDVTY